MNSFRTLTWRNLAIAVHDAFVTAIAMLASFYFRFEGAEFSERLPILLKILPLFVALSVIIFFWLRLTTTKWRFVSFPDMLNILRAATILTIVLLVLDYLFLSPKIYGAFFVGKTTMVVYWFLEVFLLSATRLTYRYFRSSRTLNKARSAEAAAALIVGRAADVEVLLRAVESGAVKALWPVGILSPSIADQGQSIRGVPVLGDSDDLQDVVGELTHRGKHVVRLVLTPSAFEESAKPEAILLHARRLGLILSRMPSLSDSREPPRLSPVAVEDLLLRPNSEIDYDNLESLVRNKSVVVTGGGGSIGSEICDRLIAFGAGRLLIIESSELALYQVTEQLAGKNTSQVVDSRIADIRDRERIFRLMAEFKPDLVFHAAALKHVPILERDWSEAVKTNIFGSINVADAAKASGAEAMVMISTDKAIEPVSVLGLTKRFAELYCQALDKELAEANSSKVPMRLISVRFGNVLASNGSVVPKFKMQIEAGGPVTVTHPDMVRYFMTIREACDLVITAANHSLGTNKHDVSVYVLNMGQPVKIVHLAERMIKLSGLEPYKDIDIVFSGMRPGERLNEILFASEEPTVDIGVSGVLAAKPTEIPMQKMREWIAALEGAIGTEDRPAIRSILKDAVPEFRST